MNIIANLNNNNNIIEIIRGKYINFIILFISYIIDSSSKDHEC